MSYRVPSIRFYNTNGELHHHRPDGPLSSSDGQLHSRDSVNQTDCLDQLADDDDSSSSGDLVFPKNVQNAVDKLREDESSSAISDQENLDDLDYRPLPVESDDDEYVEDEHASSEDEQPKKKRKKAEKRSARNPYQNKRKFQRAKINGIVDMIREDEASGLIEYTELEGGFRLPTKMWDKLYPYQQAGIKWLWELHQNSVGGIVGDDCGSYLISLKNLFL